MVPAQARPEALTDGEVHVWRIALDRAHDIIARLGSSLADEERARGDRFRSAVDRARFLAGRAALRAVLGPYSGRPGSELSFLAGPHGKPALEGVGGIEFNLTHSGDLALVAVATGLRVGVDVERVRPLDDRDSIVVRFFSPREQAEIAGLPEHLKTSAFFRVWTCKEAYIKAIGTGLYEPLDGFSVSADLREPTRLVEIEADPAGADRWTIREVDVREGYAAAVAVDQGGRRVRLFDFVGSAVAVHPFHASEGDGPQ